MAKKKTDTKDLFIKVSDKLFFQKGYENVSVDEICKKAGKAKGLFFYYFEKKENVVKLLLDMQVERMSRSLKRRLASNNNSLDKLNIIMQSLFSGEKGGPRAMYYFKERPMPEWADSFAHHLKDRYIFPLIKDTVREGVELKVFVEADSLETEIVYLGISQFMHKHYMQMSDMQYAIQSINAITRILEKALGIKKGKVKVLDEDTIKTISAVKQIVEKI